MATLKENAIMIEGLLNLFTVDKGIVKVLLIRKKEEPYKGYWVLPGSIINKEETIENNMVDTIYDKLGLATLYIEQSHTFSDVNRNPDNRVVAVSYLGLIDSITLLLKREVREDYETEWFPINNLPKLGYDHEYILNRTIEYLGKRIAYVSVLKSLFPADFTLPEIQQSVMSLLNKNFDRRNFRKKFLSLGIIEETGDKADGGSGRPAKLYRFKDDVKDTVIF